MGGQFAVAGVVILVAETRQVCGRDLQHIGAMLSESSRTDRPSDDPRQIKHPDS